MSYYNFYKGGKLSIFKKMTRIVIVRNARNPDMMALNYSRCFSET